MAHNEEILRDMVDAVEGQVEGLEDQIAQIDQRIEEIEGEISVVETTIMTKAANELEGYLDSTKVLEIEQIHGGDCSLIIGPHYNDIVNIDTANLTDWRIIGTTFNSYTNNTYWQCLMDCLGWDGIEWLAGPEQGMSLELAIGSIWQVDFRPTKLRVTFMGGTGEVTLYYDGGGSDSVSNYVSGTEIELTVTGDINQIDLFMMGSVSLIEFAESGVVYEYEGVGWDNDPIIIKYIADWDFGKDYLIHPLNTFDGDYGLYANLAALNEARNTLNSTKSKMAASESILADYFGEIPP